MKMKKLLRFYQARNQWWLKHLDKFSHRSRSTLRNSPYQLVCWKKTYPLWSPNDRRWLQTKYLFEIIRNSYGNQGRYPKRSSLVCLRINWKKWQWKIARLYNYNNKSHKWTLSCRDKTNWNKEVVLCLLDHPILHPYLFALLPLTLRLRFQVNLFHKLAIASFRPSKRKCAVEWSRSSEIIL